MKNNSASLMQVSLITGIGTGTALILLSVLIYTFGYTFENWTQYPNYLICILGAVGAQLKYRKVLGGEMSYGQALGVGLMTIVFASILMSIYTYILYKFIDPSLIGQMISTVEEKLVEQGNIPEDQIEMAIKIQSKFMKPIALAISELFGGPFKGVIISLITAIFTQKSHKNEE
jgi:hypothetical protein